MIKNIGTKTIKIALAVIITSPMTFANSPFHAAPIVIEDHRDHEKYETFKGQVLWVGNRQFDLRVGNDVYQVYSSKPLPYKMGQGYNVQVYGEPVGRNTILDANTMVISSGDDKGIYDENTRHGYENIFGVVTQIKSDLELEIRAGRRTYNIFLARKVPKQLKRGDEVSVYGPRYGWNIIRSASMKIIKGNPDTSLRKRFLEYRGVVTRVKSRSQFEIETDGETYNVYLSEQMPLQFAKEAVVSVYGQRYGRNDIRYADVVILSKDGQAQELDGKFRTFVGSVVEIRPSKSFDLRVGDIIYNVTTAVEMPRRLSRDDIVRVYGQRIGKSNIYDANIRILRGRMDLDPER